MSNSDSSPGKVQIFLALLLLTLFAGLVLVVFWYVYRALQSLSSDIAVAIIAGAATIGVSVISIVLAKIYESRQVVQKEIRDNKTPIYEEFLNFMTRLLHGEKVGKKPSEEEMMHFFIEFNQKMMVWGSDSVLSAWRDWRKTLDSLGNEKNGLMDMMHKYEAMIFAIRKDLGHRNEGLKKGDILRLFINDYDAHNP